MFQMAENKMEQVAKLFGKKLGEEFSVLLQGEYTINAKVNSIWRMKFMHRGLYIYIPNGGPDGGWWAFNRPVLSDLLTGKAEIVED
jgi:hypothetical protein